MKQQITKQKSIEKKTFFLNQFKHFDMENVMKIGRTVESTLDDKPLIYSFATQHLN